MNYEQSSNTVQNDHGITTFISDETSKVAEKRELIPLIDNILSTSRVNSEQTIKEFLARPFVLNSGLLQTSDTVSTFPAYNLMADILNTNNFKDKLSGFLGMRATTVFTLQVNATRFVQGRYMLNYYPTAGSVDFTRASRKVALHKFNLTTRTQVPGVQIDLNCETQVTLKIPFISGTNFWPLRGITNTNLRSLGVVQMHPYVKATEPVSYTLYVHFEDVELFTPTVPQSGRMSVTDQERKKANIGPVETTFRKLTKSTSYMKNIPIIGTAVSTVGWYSDILSNVASVWGWSKPEILSPPAPMYKNRGIQNMNFDGADNSMKLSLSSKNQILTDTSIFRTDVDEMAFDYIKSIPAWFATKDWKTSDAVNTVIHSFDLGPNQFITNSTDNGNAAISTHCPCSYPTNWFSYYRGGFKITMKAVKTEFHSGRLAVAFFPYTSMQGSTLPTFSNTNAIYANRTVIDVRYETEWHFEFPYVSDRMFLPCGVPYGRVEIYVENPLEAPATVSSTVNFIFEASGLPDLTYAGPAPLSQLPYYPSAPQSGGQFQCEVVDQVIGNADTTTPVNPLYNAISMGEQFTSFRQLIKRSEIRGRSAAQAATANYQVYPFNLGAVYGAGVAGVKTFPFISPDSFTMVGLMYAMARGSTRIKLYDTNPTSSGSSCIYPLHNVTGSINEEFICSGVDSYGASGPANMIGNILGHSVTQDGLQGEVQIPMYIEGLAYPTSDVFYAGTTTTGIAASNQGNSPRMVVNYTQVATGGIAPYPMRSAGDDFSYGCFISTVPLVTRGSVYNGWS